MDKKEATALMLLGAKMRRSDWEQSTFVFYSEYKFFKTTANSTEEIDLNRFHLRNWEVSGQTPANVVNQLRRL